MIGVVIFAASVAAGLALIAKGWYLPDERDDLAALCCMGGVVLILCAGLVAL